MALDITGIDIAAFSTGFGGICAGVAAIVKALKSDSSTQAVAKETELIKAQRKETAEQRDGQVQSLREEIAVLKSRIGEHEKRLDEGNDKFDRFERELKETNGLLRELLGALKIKFNLPINGSDGVHL